MDKVDHILKDIFGFDCFKPGQQEVVKTIAQGSSAAAIFPTGAGKSLCYQLSAMVEEGMTLVISPLLSLMKDQIDFLQSKNIAAAKLDSGMSATEYTNTLEWARTGKLKILMVAVERFKNERFRIQLARMKVSLIVVDEAHCISEWGHNFRPDYLKIPLYAREFNIGKVLLLTATATPQVIDDMCRKFSISLKNVVQTGFFRENLRLTILPVTEDRKNARLFEVLSRDPEGPAIVYVTLQKTAQAVANILSGKGMSAEAYHAGIKNDEREQIQNRFMNGETTIVVATIAFGMGIDKENIRKVIHYDLPKSIESYSQEIGRAGRDGNPSLCCVLGNKNNVPVLENFVYGDTPGISNIRTVLTFISQTSGREVKISPYQLSREADIRLLPLKTLLVYLEMLNFILPRYSFFESYSFEYLMPEKEIVARFEGERKQFVRTILNHSQIAKKWAHVDMDAILVETGADRQRVLAALDYFHEQGWIDLQPKSGVDVFELLEPGFDVEATARQLADLFAEKERKDISRLHTMMAFFESDHCLARELSSYFGENLDKNCGQCSVCTDKKAICLPVQERRSLEHFDVDSLVQPLAKASPSLLSVRTATRFLCGISSPLLSQYKAGHMSGFGRLASYPYKTVEQWIKQNYRQKES